METKKNVFDPLPVGSSLFIPSTNSFPNVASSFAKNVEPTQVHPHQNRPIFGGFGSTSVFTKPLSATTDNVDPLKTFSFTKSQDSNVFAKNLSSKLRGNASASSKTLQPDIIGDVVPKSNSLFFSNKSSDNVEENSKLHSNVKPFSAPAAGLFKFQKNAPTSNRAEDYKQVNNELKRRLSSSSSASKILNPSQLELCTAIQIANVPPKLNNKTFLNRHFSKYGEILRINCRLKTNTAIIEFVDHDSAKNAKEKGGRLAPNASPLKMFYVLPNSLAQSDLSPTIKAPNEQNRPLIKPKAVSDIAKRFGDFVNKKRPIQPIDGKEIAQKIPTVALEQTGNILFESENLQSIVSQLKSLIGQQAVSAREKKDLLETRDKILRKYRVKVSNVNQAAVFRGTCPDMCPEKERYTREVQKLLHPYEVIPASQGVVNHYRAVKDYSRSSADQEEPLPHELRPVDVLERTMVYLISYIPFNGIQPQIWYDFIWNRTRSIRKDITQQMLSDTAAVSLIEKCVRFHIFSAYRLCELDVADFDQRMNTENLTKCLLSLSHMYHDLNKSGISCPNESEFRCYNVLLNLDDSNILRQILTYKVEVRQSSEIRFAVKLFSLLQNNNYVGFFRLIREKATFLQACLAHRCYNRVRSEALRILCKSYTSSQTSQFPLTDLIRWLSFEDVDEATSFCHCFGLSVDEVNVHFNKATFAEPEQEIELKLSKITVEVKLRCSLGELINGGPVATVNFPEPVISFDAENRYVNDTVIKTFLEAVKDEKFVENRLTSSDGNKSPLKVQPASNEFLLTTIADDILTDVAKQIVKHTATEMYFRSLSSYFLSKWCGDVISEIVSTVYYEQKHLANALLKRKAEVKQRFEDLSSEISEDLINNTCHSLVNEIVGKELSIAKTAYITSVRKEIDVFSSIIGDDFYEHFMGNEVDTFCSNFFQREIVDRLTCLERIKKNLMLFNVRKCFAHWLKKTRRRKRILQLLDEFPLFPGQTSDSGATPPKKLRLLGSENCPTSECCRRSQTEFKNPQETDGNGVFEIINNIKKDVRKREMDASTQEIRILLDKLKQGLEKEKSFIHPNAMF